MQTNQFIQRTLEISHRIECAKVEYPTLWRKIIDQWLNMNGCDAVWLTYSANYLFLTAGVRWALDPFSLFTRLGEGIQPNFVKDLCQLKMVVLSHAHNDHLDRTLIAAIRKLKITWVVPSFMVEEVMQITDLPREHILVPQIGHPIHFGKLTITPFDAQHFRGSNGVPEMGYIAEFSDKRWIFPGDTRTYDSSCLPHCGTIDGIFAHLWLGKGCALVENPPLIDEFCSFFAGIKPQKILVTHLEEFGRTADEYWTLPHYQRVNIRFQEIAPEIQISSAMMGQHVIL